MASKWTTLIKTEGFTLIMKYFFEPKMEHLVEKLEPAEMHYWAATKYLSQIFASITNNRIFRKSFIGLLL